jgi:transporter family-2 protein
MKQATSRSAVVTSIYLIIALVGGLALTFQAGVNAQLGVRIGNPVRAAFISFAVGTVALLIFSVAQRSPWPQVQSLAAAPWWIWIGGLLGAFYVILTVVVAPELGAAVFFALVVGGQMLASLCADHFGWVGFPQHPISLGRIVGAALILAGVLLIRLF